MIDEHRALGHTGERTLRAHTDRAQIVIIAHTGHHEIRALGGLGGRCGKGPAVLCRPSLGLGRRAVIDRHLMPLGDKMPSHRISHDAETQKRYLCHDFPLPCVWIN